MLSRVASYEAECIARLKKILIGRPSATSYMVGGVAIMRFRKVQPASQFAPFTFLSVSFHLSFGRDINYIPLLKKQL